MKERIKKSYNLIYAYETADPREIVVRGFPRDRYEAVIYLASKLSGKRVLEIGCGNGRVLYTLRNNFEELYGIDISSVRVKTSIATLNGTNFNIIEADIEEELEYDNGFFDLVIWADVIEHVVDIWKAMENIQRITTQNGYLITATPNIAKIKARISLLFGKFPSTSGKNEGFSVREHEMFDGGHLHYFTISMLKKLYIKYGFRPVKHIGCGRFGILHNLYPALLSPSMCMLGQKY